VGRLAVREREADTRATGISDGERGRPLTGGPTWRVGLRCQCHGLTDMWARGI
jgi:hypothetical protein